MVSQSDLMKNTEKKAMSCHTKQNRNSFKTTGHINDMGIAYNRTELKFLGTCIIQNLKWDVEVRSLSPPHKKLRYITKSLG
jgi:hypothetical protein